MEFECLLPRAIKGRSSSRFYSHAFTGRLRSLKTRWLCLNTRFTRWSSCSSRLWTRKRENGIRQWIGFTTSKRKTRFYGILKISCKLICFESFGRCNWTVIASSYHTTHHVTKIWWHENGNAFVFSRGKLQKFSIRCWVPFYPPLLNEFSRKLE